MRRYVVTDRMLKIQSTVNEQLAVIQGELFEQKYGRAPTMMEFFAMENDIVQASHHIFQNEIVLKYHIIF